MVAPRFFRYSSRDEWLAARRGGIGGSDVPAILGISPWGTPLSVWAAKTGHEPPRDSTYSMRRGSHMEDFLADELERAAETVLVEKVFGAGDLVIAQSTLDERLRYSPDAFLLEREDGDAARVLGEWKSQLRSEERWREGAPLDVVAQVQHGMYVCDLPRAYVACDLGTEMRWQRVERDPAYTNDVVPALLRWWDEFVVAETPPPATGRDVDGSILAFLFPEDFGGAVTLPEEFASAHDELDRLEAEQKRTAARIEELKNRVRAALGDASRGVLPDGSGWTWKVQRRKGYTVDPTEFRVLRRFRK